MDFHVLTQEQKTRCCKVIVSQLKQQYLLSLDYKFFLELNEGLASYPTIELVCDLPPEQNQDTKLVFNPTQRKTIIAKTAYLKETTKFTWFISSNKEIEAKKILNIVNISFRCLEN